MKTCMVSIDVEEDLNRRTFNGVENVDKILELFDNFNVSATLFATGEVLQKYPDLIVKWSKKHEIACHGYNHIPLYELSISEREKQLEDFCELYKKILGGKPKGFRAVKFAIDNTQLKLPEELGFRYDSSVIPRYVPVRKHVGFKGKAPTEPYYPSYDNYREKGEMKILEIPNTPLIFGIPLFGAWFRVFGPKFYRALLALKEPEFITLGMHSWDIVEYKGPFSKNSGVKALQILEEILTDLQSHGHYHFTSGDGVCEQFRLMST